MKNPNNKASASENESQEFDFEELMEAPEGSVGWRSSWGQYLHTEFDYEGSILDW